MFGDPRGGILRVEDLRKLVKWAQEGPLRMQLGPEVHLQGGATSRGAKLVQVKEAQVSGHQLLLRWEEIKGNRVLTKQIHRMVTQLMEIQRRGSRRTWCKFGCNAGNGCFGDQLWG